MLNNKFNGLKIIYYSLAFSSITACNEQTKFEECPLTIDTVSIIDQQSYNNKKYYLVKRIYGWHDKSIAIQLFDKKPKNDRCNRSLITPIIEDSIMQKMNIQSFEIDLNKKIFLIKYDKKSSNIDINNPLKLKFINQL